MNCRFIVVAILSSLLIGSTLSAQSLKERVAQKVENAKTEQDRSSLADDRLYDGHVSGRSSRSAR